ncbi:hypothetical protein MTP99_006148 [Tenebrio molitor]|uniref:alpha-tocopherol transfer protein-like n=1 Tax=Tenebrio molitor TaxID=7067 RepID=UPI002706DAA7|nr:hypothetical protein MTP99_006148 [Tenebrio molitor]
MTLKLADVSTEYSKDKDLKKDDVMMLITWVNKQPHLPKINELQAILFLQCCYYRNEMAKTVIDNFFTVKTHCPEFFRERNAMVKSVKAAMDLAIFATLPKKTPEGYTIFFVKLVDTNPNKFFLADALKCLDMICLLHLHQEGTSPGHVIIYDMTGAIFSHLARLGPLTIKKFLYYLQEAMPLRLKGLHFFNIVPFMDKIFALMRPFMKKELMNKFHMHNSVDDLLNFIPRDCLPSDYGGTSDSASVLHEQMKTKMCDNIPFFAWEEKQTVDESARPGKPKSVNEIFGVEGTFKKLELD